MTSVNAANLFRHVREKEVMEVLVLHSSGKLVLWKRDGLWWSQGIEFRSSIFQVLIGEDVIEAII